MKWETVHTCPHTPGSPEAVTLGCLCYPKDNHHGKGSGVGNAIYGKEGFVFWVNPDCPVHSHKEEEQRMEFDGTEYNAAHFVPTKTEPTAPVKAEPGYAWESFELKKNETCKCPAPTVHGPEGFPGFVFEGVRYCYDCSRVIAPVNPVKCYTGEPMSALRELVIVVDHLRAICEHCEGKNKTEAKNLTAGMSLGIKTAHKYGKMLPDFERATFRADTLMAICNPVGVPNPGSDAAIALGCTCPVLDNNHGRGCNGEFWRTDGCPVHCPTESRGEG